MLQLNTSADPSRLLTSALEKLSMATNVQTITKIVAEAARELVKADGATFILRDGDRCYYADEDAISPLWKDKKFPMEACISGWSMIHGETVLIRDIYIDPRIPHDAYRPTFVKSLCMTPIRPEKAIGAIGTYWANTHSPTEEEVKVLQILSNSTAVALENIELKKAVLSQDFKNKELEVAMFALAHDLRTPICAMTSLADILRVHLRPYLNSTTDEFLDLLMKTGHQASSQIERILSLYRATNGKIEKSQVDISVIAKDILNQMRLRFPEHRISATVQDGLKTFADQRLIHMVMENLISNAIKYSSRKPEICIEVGRTSIDSQHTQFFVRDNGEGFDSADAHRLFKPLGRLHREEEFNGTGLGLASVAKIVELHGGQVSAEGKKAEGATFFFSLPNHNH